MQGVHFHTANVFIIFISWTDYSVAKYITRGYLSDNRTYSLKYVTPLMC